MSLGGIKTTKFKLQTNDAMYTKTELKIIDYIYQNISVIPFMSIGQLSGKIGISVATISRFVRHAGFQDFKELKTAIAEQNGYESPEEKMTGTLTGVNNSSPVELLQYQQFCISKTIELLSVSEVEKAVQSIISGQTVYLYGKGASASLASLFHFRLNRLGKNTVILPAGGSELFESLVHAGKNDLVIVFGFQKIPQEAKVILEYRKEAAYKTLLISSKLFDGDERRADVNLFVYRGENKEYHSMAAPIALIDALVVMTAQRMGSAALESLSSLYQLKEKYIKQIPR